MILEKSGIGQKISEKFGEKKEEKTKTALMIWWNKTGSVERTWDDEQNLPAGPVHDHRRDPSEDDLNQSDDHRSQFALLKNSNNQEGNPVFKLKSTSACEINGNISVKIQ